MLKFISRTLRWLKFKRKQTHELPEELYKGPQLDQQVTQEIRHVIVGLDFGTSSTKVLYRDLEKGVSGEAYPINFNHGIAEYSNFVLPSIVTLNNDRLYFGRDPLSNLNTFLSLKRCMGCQGGKFQYIDCPYYKDRNKCIYIETKQIGSIPVKFLCALYLAYVLEETNKVIQCRYGSKYDVKVLYNMGIPVDHFENDDCKKLFEETLRVAERLMGHVGQGMLWDDAYQMTLREFQNINIVSQSENKITILKETFAPIFSVILHPSYESGDKHAIIDVGAGTTDIVFFELPEREKMGGIPRLFTLHPRAYSIGCDDIDQGIFKEFKKLNNIPDKWNPFLHAIRLAKHYAEQNNVFKVRMENNNYSIPIELYNKVTKAIADKIYEYYRATAWNAYQKRKRVKLWEELTLFRIGGGNKIRCIRKRLEEPLPLGYEKNIKLTLRDLPLPDDLKIDSGKGELWVRDNYGFFSIAYGLTLYPQRWPKIIPSDKVRPLPPKPRVDIPDRDQLYPEN